jgi:hypothetical protein
MPRPPAPAKYLPVAIQTELVLIDATGFLEGNVDAVVVEGGESAVVVISQLTNPGEEAQPGGQRRNVG